MDDKPDPGKDQTPSFVPDEAATAGDEKPAVAPDPAPDTEGASHRPGSVPDDFEADDAITKTAIDEGALDSPGRD